MMVKFIPNDTGNPAGKLADAELHFSGGPLDGLKLIGFAVWERKGGGRNVTFPASDGVSLLTPSEEVPTTARLVEIMLGAYAYYAARLRPVTV